MRWPLRIQFFIPFALLLTLSVLAVAIAAGWNSINQIREQKLRHSRSVAKGLGDASFPLTQNIAERIAAMVDGEVIAVDSQRRVTATTLTIQKLPPVLRKLSNQTDPQTAAIVLNDVEYVVTVIPRFRSPQPGPLFVLLPQRDLTSLRRDAITQTLVVTATTLFLAMLLAGLLARRVSRRVDGLRGLFAELAKGNYQLLPVGKRNDEVKDLLVSANRLSEQLQALQKRVQTNERLGLLSQLSGGLAHQLKNSITGAKMALQLHQQQCENDKSDLLNTAMCQLKLTEEQVLAVLSLGNPDQALKTSQSVVINDIFTDLIQLLRPQCLHWKTDLHFEGCCKLQHVKMNSVQGFKGAILNLVLNAIEAAGVGGAVKMSIQLDQQSVTIKIKDNGPGFDQCSSNLRNAFQSTKPEGIGLGLTIADHAVRQERGVLLIDRENDWTVVTIILNNTSGINEKDKI